MSKQDGRPVAIMIAYDEKYAAFEPIVLPVLKRYASRHRYIIHGGYRKYQEDPSNLRDYGDRSKIDLYCQLYDDFEIVCWLDIDALIMNHNIKVEDVLGARPFLWTYDPSGPCSGFWIARCTPQVRHTLTTVQRLAQERGAVVAHENLGPPHSVTLTMEPRGTSDQTTMRSIMHIPPYSHILGHCVPGKQAGHCYHNAVYHGWAGMEDDIEYRPGDWIVTAPSRPIEERLEILREYAATLEKPLSVPAMAQHA